jgi:hypothetical protein
MELKKDLNMKLFADYVIIITAQLLQLTFIAVAVYAVLDKF